MKLEPFLPAVPLAVSIAGICILFPCDKIAGIAAWTAIALGVVCVTCLAYAAGKGDRTRDKAKEFV